MGSFLSLNESSTEVTARILDPAGTLIHTKFDVPRFWFYQSIYSLIQPLPKKRRLFLYIGQSQTNTYTESHLIIINGGLDNVYLVLIHSPVLEGSCLLRLSHIKIKTKCILVAVWKSFGNVTEKGNFSSPNALVCIHTGSFDIVTIYKYTFVKGEKNEEKLVYL